MKNQMRLFSKYLIDLQSDFYTINEVNDESSKKKLAIFMMNIYRFMTLMFF